MSRGVFVTVDGPGGVGKSTVTRLLAACLLRARLPVWETAQPSASSLGQFVRCGSDTYDGIAYACLVAADRYHHLEYEIRPALEAGRLVICDRYVASSLVLQRMDGVPEDLLEHLAAYTDVPDLTIILNAEPEVLAARIAQRGVHSRFERDPANCAVESQLYRQAAGWLRGAGAECVEIDCTTRSAESIAGDLAARIECRATHLICSEDSS